MLGKQQKKLQKQRNLKKVKYKIYAGIILNTDNSEDIAIFIRPIILN